MRPPDHYALSLRCRRKTEQEIEQNDLLTAAEMMWGAVVHAIKHTAPKYTPTRFDYHHDIATGSAGIVRVILGQRIARAIR